MYQTLFAPVRAIYGLIGPTWTPEISERWGVVDLVREATSPAPGRRVDWLLAVLLALGAVERRRGGKPSRAEPPEGTRTVAA